MDRLDVIRGELGGKGRYLEIGVSAGTVFRNVQAVSKTGVDPAFAGRRMRLSVPYARAKRAVGLKSGLQLFEETSDVFFARPSRGPYDCVLIDGLHTGEQAYRDVDHALDQLASDGLIVLHDCNPQTPVAALGSLAEARAHPDWAGTWNGTVWQAILRLRTRPDLNVKVLNCDEGLGLVRPGAPDSILTATDAAITGYPEFAADRARLLNLVAP